MVVSSGVKATAASNAANATGTASVTDQAVLDYLKSKGMGKAVLELSEKIKEEQQSLPASKLTSPAITREKLESEEEAYRAQRTVLMKSTGGGFGYDRDAATPIAQWGVPDNFDGNPINKVSADGKRRDAGSMGEREAKSYLDAFVALQLWILSLPDDSGSTVGWKPKITNVIAKAKAIIIDNSQHEKSDILTRDVSMNVDNQNGSTLTLGSAHKESVDEEKEKNDKVQNKNEMGNINAEKSKITTSDSDNQNKINSKVTESHDAETKHQSVEEDTKQSPLPDSNILSTVVSELAKPSTTEIKNKNHDASSRSAVYPIPPSAKAELLSVSFALLVHTYCELLEVGMESTAHVLRDAFQPIYDPLPSGYGTQYKDLYHCVTTEDMVKLNTHNSQHMEALANLKTILVQIATMQMKEKELTDAITATSSRGNAEPGIQQARQKKLQEYEQTIGLLQRKHTELSQRASHAFDRMYDLPFLRRARAVRWQLTLSTTSYGMLCQFLNANMAIGKNDTSLLAMSTLLQTKCELHVEQREPLPFTPAVILEESSTSEINFLNSSATKNERTADENKSIQWAAPMRGLLDQNSERPFPKFHLEEIYEDKQSAQRGKRSVEFNRSLLINGFRRLEALERKRDFHAMSKRDSENIGQLKHKKEIHEYDTDNTRVRKILANPLEPSIMLSTLCANQSRRRDDSDRVSNDKSFVNNYSWEEASIGITCAKICPPDGRKVAIGCDDSAIRIWNLMDDAHHNKHGSGNRGGSHAPIGDASQVLLGHKNGFPVFDLSWNRDGRCLLSAGGDGSIRLWDTAAQGPFGEVIKSSGISGTAGPATSSPFLYSPNSKKSSVTSTIAKEKLLKATENLEKIKTRPGMTVPGLRPESKPYTSGAALAVYRGHAPNTPIWSVAFSPSGYYFASGGSDATARLWTTDRSIPVRLFTGHTSNCIHSVVFHPNCNYILTGSDDKTVRLWDIQTGQCVRLLNGCPAGIYKVDIDPSGQYAIGADLLGTVHVWDLATGKKVTELRSSHQNSQTADGNIRSQHRQSVSMIHSFAFSSCGTALATGGDDRCVRIWDIRKATMNPKPIVANPIHTFSTQRTAIMDLQYTKRNLLLSAGKYISAVPTITLANN